MMALYWLAALLVPPAPAPAANLAQVDRTVAKEPAYQTTPRYCLLAFGLDARTRVWLVQDGDTLYVDRNGNGDLTEAGKRVQAKQQQNDGFCHFQVGDLTLGGLTHTGLTVTRLRATQESVGNEEEWARIKNSGPEPWMWSVSITAERDAADPRDLPRKVGYVINGDGAGMLLFAGRPQEAPIIHLNGPFTLALQDRRQRLIAGDQAMLQIGVGPQGVGPGTFAFVLYPDTIPGDAYPEAEITFPAAPGQEPIQRKFVLKQRC